MKIKYVLILLPCFIFAQSKEDKKEKNKGKNTEIVETKNDQKTVVVNSKDKEELEKLKVENKQLKDILTKVNAKYFVSTFKNFYSDDYFKTQGFKILKEEDKNTISQAQLMVESILAAEDKNSEIYKRAKKSIVFTDYLKAMDEVFQTVMKEKYDSVKVSSAITRLHNLQKFDPTSKVEVDKNSITEALVNYKENACNATEVVTKIQQGVMKSGISIATFKSKDFDNIISKKKTEEPIIKFNQLMNDDKIFNPFLVDMINDVKKNPTSFNQSTFIDEKYCQVKTKPLAQESKVDTMIVQEKKEELPK
ncbi:hypothetical protein [Algoriella xinjiangensis]|uniref:Uncharacterized protein n=1 Tax=Algoriella xinjiangensis TaxID=684065 RepID=A0A1I4XRN9_9FLAO|nr:hypothetical protein [Algoriella xinjiangensis]SFN28521.1 hypothetical protein SAMN05421738_109145 [Algoriella xinjiangensis]